MHIPGKSKAAPDTISRHNSGEKSEVQEVGVIIESMRGQEKSMRFGVCQGLARREEDDKEAEECDRREEAVISAVGVPRGGARRNLGQGQGRH